MPGGFSRWIPSRSSVHLLPVSSSSTRGMGTLSTTTGGWRSVLSLHLLLLPRKQMKFFCFVGNLFFSQRPFWFVFVLSCDLGFAPNFLAFKVKIEVVSLIWLEYRNRVYNT